MNSSGCRGKVILGGIILGDENFLIAKDFPVYVNGQPLEDFGFVETVFGEDESEEINHEDIR